MPRAGRSRWHTVPYACEVKCRFSSLSSRQPFALSARACKGRCATRQDDNDPHRPDAGSSEGDHDRIYQCGSPGEPGQYLRSCQSSGKHATVTADLREGRCVNLRTGLLFGRHTIIGWRIGPEPVTVDNFLLEVREPYKTGILYPDSQVVVSSDTLQGSSRAGHRQRRPSDTP